MCHPKINRGRRLLVPDAPNYAQSFLVPDDLVPPQPLLTLNAHALLCHLLVPSAPVLLQLFLAPENLVLPRPLLVPDATVPLPPLLAPDTPAEDTLDKICFT